MHVGLFSTKPYDRVFFDAANAAFEHTITYLDARLTTFPNVIITGHQAFFTREALHNIAHTTLQNVQEFQETGACANHVVADAVMK